MNLQRGNLPDYRCDRRSTWTAKKNRTCRMVHCQPATHYDWSSFEWCDPACWTTPAAPAAHTRYLSSPAAATLHGKTQGFVLRLPPHNTEHATFMQPFQCDLQPQLQETHRTTPRTQEQPLVAEHREGTKRPQPQPPHTRGTFHRRLQPLYTEKHKVSCSGFLPTTQSMQLSCSHSNAICNHSFKKRIELNHSLQNT